MEGLEDFRFAVEGIGLVRVRSNLTITSSFHNFYLTLKASFCQMSQRTQVSLCNSLTTNGLSFVPKVVE